MDKKYYLGLDMGTSSVGWAVTDENYRILRAKGKDLWGIREFDEADSAEGRRQKRTSRRRYQREKVRQGLIRSYFADAIEDVDKEFFVRLDNSFYFEEDKEESVRYSNAIFNDDNYNDAQYYKEFPTVFHLRKELLENKETHDVRLVYLAIANMFKHRGHFLNSGLGSEENISAREDVLADYFSLISEIRELTITDKNMADQVYTILGNSEYSRTQKKEELIKLLKFDIKSDKEKIPFISILCGLNVKVGDLFPNVDFEDNKYAICFNVASYDDKIAEIVEKIGEDKYPIIEAAKSVYDEGILTGILGDYLYLSQARVASYEKHSKDLAILKRVFKKYCSQEEYESMFRTELLGTYGAYVKSINSNGILSRRGSESKSRKQEELYKKIKGILKPFSGDKNVDYILTEIERESFLPKQLTNANGTIPNQVHVIEMKKILENASNYLRFLNDVDESGLSVKERIVRLFSFQIPYYVGPVTLNSAQSGGNGWVIRKEEGQILPWNISNKIDMDATQVEFISRLVRECSYLAGEKVLPKSSLIYEKYCVLNEINKIKIDGELMPVSLKQDIFNNLFTKGKKVTRKGLEKYLIGRGVIEDPSQLSGIDIAINNSLSSYAKFYSIFGDELSKDQYISIVEDIIFLSTIYGDSRSMLKEVLVRKYSEVLDETSLKKILGYKFKDWGRLSREFLELQGCDKHTGEIVSIIKVLWDTNHNLMEIINSDEYTFREEILKRKVDMIGSLTEFDFEDLDKMYFSAPVKRMIWQTSLVLREIEKAMGNAPERVFIEMTRGEEEKKRTISRKNELLELLKTEGKEWKELIERADSDGSLRSKKLYLYIKQLGKCMYTGEQIDLDRLFDDSLYDIDHIYPRSKVKDNNLNNNLVLVKRQANASKTDVYPIGEDIYLRMKMFWKLLWDKKLINDEKYKRLMNRNPFTEEQLSGFIARQLVETSQGTKGIADIMKQLLPNTTIVYSKASNVSEFRQKFNIYKCRSVNELHHAHDAYLNIVVGNVYYTKFTQNPSNFIKHEYMTGKTHYNLYRMFDWDVVRGSSTAWIGKNKGSNSSTISIVKKMLSKTTPILTRLSYTGHGAISNETLYSGRVAKKDNYIPIKSGDERLQDVSRYGGYTSLNPAYFIFIEHGNEGKRKRCFDVVPLYYSQGIKTEEDLVQYCESKLGYINVRVICRKIKKNSLFKLDGYFVYISGLDNRKNVEFYNATSMFFDERYNEYIHELENIKKKGYMSEKINCESNIRLYHELVNKHTNGIFRYSPKPLSDILIKGKEDFEQLSTAEQADVLTRIISLTSVGRTNVSLKEIGGPSENGRIRISGNMTGRNELLLINYSPAGLTKTVIDLLRE